MRELEVLDFLKLKREAVDKVRECINANIVEHFSEYLLVCSDDNARNLARAMKVSFADAAEDVLGELDAEHEAAEDERLRIEAEEFRAAAGWSWL